MPVGVIIPAGGSGKRMESDIEKQFLKINNTTILDLTLKRFNNNHNIDDIVLVLPENRIEKYKSILYSRYNKIKKIVAGGKERVDSVFNGFRVLDESINKIMIHDCVRSFVTDDIIDKCIKALDDFECVTAAVKVKDTIKIVENGFVSKTPDRNVLWQTQTPQGFIRQTFEKAINFSKKEDIKVTDECQLAEILGIKVYVVEGNYKNIKITTKEDLDYARTLLKY